MLTFFIFVALTNLVLGYCLGTMLLRPLPAQQVLLVAGRSFVVEASAPCAKHHDVIDAVEVIAVGERIENVAATALANVDSELDSDPQASARSNTTWTAPCLDIRHDIAALRDRIQYAMQARDKKINQALAFEVQCRTPAWQQLLHDKLTAHAAELERDPLTKGDCIAPESCLAQIETLQTNLKILDWSESSDLILKKLERELEAVKILLPAKM